MNVIKGLVVSALLLICAMASAQEIYGADIPYATYEAENMITDGEILGPLYEPFHAETESSGQRCVLLGSKGRFVEFTSKGKANSMIIRFSLPDNDSGEGTQLTLGLFKNGKLVDQYKISSHYSLLYGAYPFSNNPNEGNPRNFYDELRITGLKFVKGDVIKIQRNDKNGDNAEFCIIDLIDLEMYGTPAKPPIGSISITDKTFGGANPNGDYTNALKNCIAVASAKGKTVWIPAGIYKITGDIIIPDGTAIKGAGMWYSILVGDKDAYTDPQRRVRLKGAGSNIILSDFAIIGNLNYRNDNEPNDGIVGSFGVNSAISRLWIEHTKTGIWVENTKGLVVEGCRFRNTIADGVNFCVGVRESTIRNCTARSTGDDCFAIWPATFIPQDYIPGLNTITRCTAQLPFLANGAAIYGGESNHINNCTFSDITQGSAILVSTTFPTADRESGINNNFSGTTIIENCTVKTSGGFDHEWGWRGAVQICLDKREISGIELNNLTIVESLSDGLSIIARNEPGKEGRLSKAMLRNIVIPSYSLATKGKNGFLISKDVSGSLILINSNIADTKNESKTFLFKRNDF